MTTLGVAISVPEPWGGQLQEYRAALGDVTAEGIPTHITLMPPFEASAEGIDVIEDHLEQASAAHSPFKLHLRGTGTFRPVSPVVFVVVVEGISSCEQLAFAIRRGPLACELQFPYHPHVTIAHDIDDELLDRAFKELSSFDCEFEVTSFLLYVHERGIGWQPTREFILGGR